MLLVKSTIDADVVGSAERRALSDSRLCGRASSFPDSHAVFIAVLSKAGKTNLIEYSKGEERMAKKLIALILAVMLVLSLMSPVYAVSKPIAATAADTRTVNVGVISYLTDELGSSGWQVHYWGGTSDAGDADMTSTGKTEQKNVGYWDSAQTFGMYTATIPADATGFKVHNGGRWFGDDGTAGQKAYVFNYSDDKALGRHPCILLAQRRRLAG